MSTPSTMKTHNSKSILHLTATAVCAVLAMFLTTRGHAQEAAGQTNLFVPEITELISAPVAQWEQLLTGGLEISGIQNAEVVFGFKDDKAATITGIRVLITQTDPENIKTLELFVSDSPTGPFKAAAKIEPANIYLAKTHGWQDFKINPVTAKNFKFKLATEHGNYVKVAKDGEKSGLQVIGTIKP